MKKGRKSVNLNEKQYEVLTDYASAKGITNGEAIVEMQKDIDLLKAHELNTISENAMLFCDQVETLADCARLPDWLRDAIKSSIRPIILQGMISNKKIDFEALRESWDVPIGMRLVACFDKD